MSKALCFLGFAIFTIFVGMALALIVLSMFTPWHIVSDHYVNKDNDSDFHIRSKCNCLTELEVETEEHTQTEFMKKANDKHVSQHPSLVSVGIKKYLDDRDNLYTEFTCTAVILTQDYVIGGNGCLGNLIECTASYCTDMFRIRTHSQFWSVGGCTHKVTKVYKSPDKLLVVFKTSPSLTKCKAKKVDYPGKQEDMPQYYLLGWESIEQRPMLRYGPVQVIRYMNNKACGNETLRVGPPGNGTGAVGRPFLTVCNELTGFEHEGGVINLGIKSYRDWIEGFVKSGKKTTAVHSKIKLYKFSRSCTIKKAHCEK